MIEGEGLLQLRIIHHIANESIVLFIVIYSEKQVQYYAINMVNYSTINMKTVEN